MSFVLRCLPFACSIAPLAAQTPLRLEMVVEGLSRPVLAVAPPGDTQRLFIVEQTGRIRILRSGTLLPTPFLDLTTSSSFAYGGEMGLLGLAFHPDFARNGQVFVFHGGNPWPTNFVKRLVVSASNPDVLDPNSSTTLLTVPMVYGSHNGGMLAFGDDGYLYVGIGDGGSTPPLWPDDPFNHAQRGDSLLGKMLRIDVDRPQPPLSYGIPASNPFVGPGDPRDEIWSLGLRNPWRFSFDRLTGDLWIGDVGGQREEVDFEPRGALGGRNYGWSCMSGTYCTGVPVCTCNGASLTLPIHEYPIDSRGQAMIGGYVYRGVAIPDLRGTYFYADFARREIWSLRRAGNTVTQLTNRTTELTPAAPHFLIGPSGFGEDAYGELYVCDMFGKLYKIVPAAPVQVGVATFGSGTGGCSGPHVISGVGSPVVGHPAFELRCTRAPQAAVGLLGLADQPDLLGSDLFGLGFRLHLGVAAPLFLLLPVASDASGLGRFTLAIPPAPQLAGFTLHAQAFWPWPASVCSPSVSGWSSSPGLSITLQP